MAESDNVAAVRDFVDRAWNAGEEAVFHEHLAPDFAFPGGPNGFKAMIFSFRSAFPDFELEVEDMFGMDDKVVSRFTMRGTHQGEFMGIAPTGKRVEFGGIAIDVMRDLKRVDGWAQLDRLGLLTQLGVVEGPPSAPISDLGEGQP
jgi:predicted ester cyclase